MHIEVGDMARSRGLITDTERNRIAQQVEVEDSKRYQAISRVRRRINEELPQEIELLAQHHPKLLEELRNTVCKDETSTDENERKR
jgi:hypothetical protein